jgi:hypothetical protein
MTTLMLLRVKGDGAKLERYAAQNPDVIKAISGRGAERGALRHRFFATADEILVVDEWPDQQSFQGFFDDSPEIQEMMAAVGATSPPEVVFARELATGDAIG